MPDAFNIYLLLEINFFGFYFPQPHIAYTVTGAILLKPRAVATLSPILLYM